MSNKNNIFFTAANGFPASSYQFIFDQLPEYNFHYIDLLAHDIDLSRFSWEMIADKLICEIQQRYNEPVIALGHSVGATTTLLAAAKRPELFKQLILIEPIFFKPLFRLFIALNRLATKNRKRNSLAQQALIRKSRFDSKHDAKIYFSRKTLFESFTEQALDNYIDHGLAIKDGKLQLRFSKYVEAAIFASSPTRVKYPKTRLNIDVLLGASSDLLAYIDTQRLDALPSSRLIYRPGDHLFPFEEPERFSELLRALISNHQPTLNSFIQTSQQLSTSLPTNEQQGICFSHSLAVDSSETDFLAQALDEDSLSCWLADIQEFRYTQKTLAIINSQFNAKLSISGYSLPLNGSIVEFEKNRSVKLVFKNNKFIIHGMLSYDNDQANKQLTYKVSARPLGLAKLFAPLSNIPKQILRRHVIRSINNLKKQLSSL